MNNDNGINKYNSYIEDRKVNRELINWSWKLFRILNFVGGAIFILSSVSTVVSYVLLTSSLTSVALAVNTLLPFCVSSFFVSAILGGILVVSNVIILVDKIILEINGKRLNKKINEFSKKNINNEKGMRLELSKENDNNISKNNDIILEKKNFFQYIPLKSIENSNIAISNKDSKVKKKTLVKK